MSTAHADCANVQYLVVCQYVIGHTLDGLPADVATALFAADTSSIPRQLGAIMAVDIICNNGYVIIVVDPRLTRDKAIGYRAASCGTTPAMAPTFSSLRPPLSPSTAAPRQSAAQRAHHLICPYTLTFPQPPRPPQ